MNQQHSLRAIHAQQEPTETTLVLPIELMLVGDVQKDTTVQEDLSCQRHVTSDISAQPTPVSQSCAHLEPIALSSTWHHSHVQPVSSAPPTELTTTPSVSMEPIVEKVRDSHWSVQRASSVPAEQTTTIRPLDVVHVAEANTVTKDPIRVRTAGLATSVQVLLRDQTQETQSSMVEKYVLPATTVARALTQQLRVRWATTQARKEMGMQISAYLVLRIRLETWLVPPNARNVVVPPRVRLDLHRASALV